MPAWVQDEDIWNKAKAAVKRSDYSSDDSYWAVVASVYKKMGGGVKGEMLNYKEWLILCQADNTKK
jgi:hypothetical protein